MQQATRPKYRRIYGDAITRYWPKVDKRGLDDCWEWLAHRDENDYGTFRGPDGMVKAHRFAWELANGPIPEGMSVLHRCDNPPCVNDRHLFLGTQVDNMDDMVAKGRQGGRGYFSGRQGADHWRARLSDDDVREIRRRYAAGGISQRALGDEYGIHNSSVCNIIKGKRWGHVK